MNEPRTPSLAQIMLRAVDAGLVRTRVALPARVERFDAATQLASVKPQLREAFEDGDGNEGAESLPVINDVPVQFPGGGGFVITFPVAAGDPCWLVFSDRSLDKWIAEGGEVDPVDLRRHHLSDAVALLGVRSKAAALAEFDAARMELGKIGGPRIALKATEIHLGVNTGENATDSVALANLVLDRLTKLQVAFDAHMHATAGTGPPVTPTPNPAAGIPVGSLVAVGSAVVKCKP